MSILDDINDATDSVLSFLLRPVRGLVRSGLRVVAGWAQAIFHLVSGAWDTMSVGVGAFAHGGAAFRDAVYRGLFHLFRVVIPGVIAWAAREIAHLAASLEHVAVRLGVAIEHAVTKAWSDLQDGLSWFYRHVIAPVQASLAAAEHFLYHEVRGVVDLVTHPARLFEWIWEGMLASVPGLTRDLAAPTFRWLRHSAARDTVEAAHALESVLVAIL